MNEKLKYLQVDLPEDIAKLKAYGDFERMQRVIDKRIAKGIPKALEERLKLEKILVKYIPEAYPFDYDQALEVLKGAFEGFKEEELVELWEMDAVDWYYINGKVHFKDDIVANLVKTRPHLAKRVKNKKDLEDKEGNFSMLDDVIADMKAKGELAYKFKIRSSIKIKEDSIEEGKKVKVHIPLAIEYAQAEKVKLLNTSHKPVNIGDREYPARTVYFEEECKAGDEYFVEYEFENHMTYVDPKPEKAMKSQPTFYTEELYPHIVFNLYMRELTAEVIGDEKNPITIARKIYDFITSKVMYSFVRPYASITNIPNYGGTSLKGDCGIQALMFITMCRIAKIPARWQGGLYANKLSIGNHDWAQFYVAPYGWMFADCSFGGAAYREGATERWNFYFGNLEPYRVPLVSDFQHDFYPERAYFRNDPYDNQNGEIEYEDRALNHNEYEVKFEVLSIEKIN